MAADSPPSTTTTAGRFRSVTVGMAAELLLEELGVEGVLFQIHSLDGRADELERSKTLYTTFLDAASA